MYCGPVGWYSQQHRHSLQLVINSTQHLQTRMRLLVQGQREVGIGFDLDNLAVATAERAEPIIVLYRANTRCAHVA
jgi:hypothetical protein